MFDFFEFSYQLYQIIILIVWVTPMVLKHSDFPLRGHLTMSGDMFVCHIWEKGCYWHPGVDRGQGAVNTLQCPGR